MKKSMESLELIAITNELDVEHRMIMRSEAKIYNEFQQKRIDGLKKRYRDISGEDYVFDEMRGIAYD